VDESGCGSRSRSVMRELEKQVSRGDIYPIWGSCGKSRVGRSMGLSLSYDVEWDLWDSLSVFTGLSFSRRISGEKHDLMV
jgi:hypothetical protein